MAEIMVVVEHRKGILAEISLEMLSKGRQLADQWDAKLLGVIIGGEIEKYAPEIANWADKVLVVKDNNLEGSQAEPYQKILSPLIKERKPVIVLIAHSSFGMDLALALAVELEAPLATDCTDIFIENGKIKVKRSIYGGKIDALYSFSSSEVIIITGRPGQFIIEATHKGGEIEMIDSPLKEEISYKRFRGYIEPEVGDVDITKSRILISVGRGLKDKANISVVEKFAKLLGVEIACSRPVVDYGWLPNNRQVGVSGKTVKPEIYIALGISGAIQHLAGIKGSGTIIAINKDQNAPIFNVADYGIIGDIFKVVPALIQKINEFKG